MSRTKADKARLIGACHTTAAFFVGLLLAAGIILFAFGCNVLKEMVVDAWMPFMVVLIVGSSVSWGTGRWLGFHVLVQGNNSWWYSLVTVMVCVAVICVALAAAGWGMDASRGQVTFAELIGDNIGKTLFWVFWLGGLPILLTAAIMAWSLRRQRKVLRPSSLRAGHMNQSAS